jgi:hypothetical protein
VCSLDQPNGQALKAAWHHGELTVTATAKNAVVGEELLGRRQEITCTTNAAIALSGANTRQMLGPSPTC